MAEGTSIEAACDILEGLAGRGKHYNGQAPPGVKVDTAGVMTADVTTFPDNLWVVNDLDWVEEETVTNAAGNRIRARVTVSLLEANNDTTLRTAADQAARTLGGQIAQAITVKARAGDSLQSIAKRHLGDAGKWTVLIKLNPDIRDPRKLKEGQNVRVPQ